MEEKTEIKNNQAPRKKKLRWLRFIGKLFLWLILFFILLVLFIRSPWGQSIIVENTVSYISKKTNTKVDVERLFVTFDGALQMDGLYLEDQKGDTLVYSKSLEAKIPIWSIITGKGIGVDALEWEGFRANIIRKDSVAGYNFQFLIDAFTTSDNGAEKTSGEPLKIILGKLHFTDFDIVFDDAVAGIDSRFKIGNLQVRMDNIDLEQMHYDVSNFELSDSNIKLIQSPVPTSTDDDGTSPLPHLSVEIIKLKNVYVDYKSNADHLATNFDIGLLETKIPKVNLAEKDFEIEKFDLWNSNIAINTAAIPKETENAPQAAQPFEWPQILFSIGSVDLKNNSFSYVVDNEKPSKGHFNPNAIMLSDLNLQASGIAFKDKTASLAIDNSSFKEVSGLDLKQLRMALNVTDNVLTIKKLKTALNNNLLQGELRLDYPTLSKLIEAPEASKVAVNIDNFQASLNDVFLIQPDLKNNQYLNALSTKLLTGSANMDGYLSDIHISNMQIHWGSSTAISANGTVQNITVPENLQFDIPRFAAETTHNDLVQFVDENELGFSLPDNIQLAGNMTGSLENVVASAKLTSSQGNIILDGSVNSAENIKFDTDLTIDNYHLGQLLKDEQLGALTLNAKASGNGKTINNLDANIEANISSFDYNSYQIKDLKLNGDIKNGRGKITSNYKDYNLDMGLYATVQLDSIAPEANMELNIKGIDLKALGLMQRDVRAGMKVYADFKGNATSYDIAAIVDDGIVVYDDKPYLIGDLNALAHVSKDTTSVSVKNKVVNLLLQSNAEPQVFSKALLRHVKSYFYQDKEMSDSITNPVNLKLQGKIAQAPILNEVFLVNVKDLDTINIDVDFHEKERQLRANITAPHINYSGNELDSLAFTMDTDMDKFNFDLGFRQIKAGPFNIKKTKIEGNQANNELSLSFLAHDDDEKLIQIMSKITGNREQLRFHIIPTDLILNKTPWATPESNEILISKNKLVFNDFRFTKDNQSIEITDKHASISKDHIAIDFENFELNEFLSYLNPDEQLASGDLNGYFIVEEPFSNTGLVAGLNITRLNLMQVDLGTLSLDAKSLGGNSYDFNAAMKDGEIDLDLIGDYVAKPTGANLDLNLDINRFNMTALNGFTQGQITETDGSFSGNFKVSGTTAKPKYGGSLTFADADFRIAMFNAGFTLSDETLNIDNGGLTLNNFTVLDENKNTFVASGKIGTESFINPTFDLNVKANNFQVLNATDEDNDFLYGKASFAGEAKITGDLEIPVINMNMTVGSDTNVTYVMPTATTNIEERDGVIIFVNRDDPDAILTRTSEKTASIKGVDVSALLKIGRQATVTILIDKKTGDNFKVSGEGDLNFTMNPNGRMTLAGVYEVNSGHYELNLYGLVNRKFNIANGSRVTWSGDPFDAKLDVKAMYEVKTSASSLMAPVFSGDDASVKGKFRQTLPFYVYLNIDGQLMRPEINFSLDMPEDQQGAIGGQVYGRVQQLNQQEDELNRQVFSLLVLNRFYPDPGSDGSTGGVASIARDNLNDAVSDQLNMFSDKLLGNSGFELNFGLDSYTDYQGSTPQERTQLDIAAQKKLFNDRLIVSVGSEVNVQGTNAPGEETPIIGNVSIEYILSENGRYRIKGFRRNEFENVIDGQTIISGIALIFTQEFNKFHDLWEAMFRSQVENENEEKSKLETTDESTEQKND